MYLEHCIAPFLNKCDANNDHMITLEEWGNCLEIPKVSNTRFGLNITFKCTQFLKNMGFWILYIITGYFFNRTNWKKSVMIYAKNSVKAILNTVKTEQYKIT